MARTTGRRALATGFAQITSGGLIVAALLLGGCSKDQAPLTAASSKYEVGESSGSPAASDSNDNSTSAGDPGRAANPVSPAAGGSAGSAATGTSPSSPSTTTPAPSSAGSPPPASSSPGAGSAVPSGAPPIKPPPVSRDQLDNIEPPAGPPEAIWAFIEALDRRAPRGSNQQEMLADVRRILAARIMAAESLVANKEAAVDLRRKGADVVLSTLQYLSDLGEPNVQRRVRDFCTALQGDSDPDLALTGRMMVFSLDIADLVDGRSDQPGLLLESALKLLAEEEKSATVFEYLRTAALSMLESGHKVEGRKLADALGQAYAETTDPALARQLRLMYEEAHFLELDLNKKLMAFAQGEPDTLTPLTEATTQLLSKPNPGLGTLQQTAFIADAVERKEHLEAAKGIYTQIGEAYASNQDAELQKLVRETVDYADRRLSLVNQPLSMQGKLFDGSDFKASDYAGKVLLVTFWSAENVQYMQEELPQIKRLRDVYRERGFEVVGVNVDSNRKLVEQFFAFQPMPWPTIMDGSDGMNKLVNQYGVRSIPFNLLVDSKGVVVALHVNSQSLPAKLLELLNGSASPPAAPGGNSGAAARGTLERTVAGAATAARDLLRRWSWAVDDMAGVPRAPQFVAFVDEPAEDDNPYLAPPGLSRAELVEFLLKMQEKPQVIRARPGFDAALVEAADRILAAQTDDLSAVVAFEVKARALHTQASQDAPAAQEALNALVEHWQADSRPRIAAEVTFLQLERRVLDVDQLPLAEVPALLDTVKQFFQATKTNDRHVRLASATVHAINRLDVELREPYFQEFGKLFGTSQDKQLAAYGRRIAETESTPGQDLIGQPIELHGLTALGVELDWSAYRGKAVLIDFWATWCGPCRRETPLIKDLRSRYHERGFEVVGINLDKDQAALAKYLDEQDLPWANVIGEAAQTLSRRYEVRGIPTLMLVDQQGKVVAVSHKSAELESKLEALLKNGK